MFRQIGHKIIVVVGVVVSLAMLGMIYYYTLQQEKSVLAQNHRTMAKLTQSVSEGLQTVMLAGYADIAHNFAERLKGVPEVVDFLVLRTSGEEAFLDNNTINSVNNRLGDEEFLPRERERHHQVIASTDPNLQSVLSKETLHSYYETSEQGEKLLTFLASIDNDRDCHRCHGGAKPVRGVLKLTTSLAPIQADIENARRDSLFVLIFALVTVFIVTSYLIRRSVTSPINRLTRAMADISQGDYSQEVPVMGRDELSHMADSFNRMSRQVLNTYEGLKSEQDKLNTIILSSPEGIVVTNSDGDIVLVNPSAEAILGKPREKIIREGLLQLVDNPQVIGRHLQASVANLEPSIIEYNNRTLQMLAASIYDQNGMVIGSSALFRDITEEKRLEQRLIALSTTDGLTGLFNRRHLDQTLALELKKARRYRLELSILMFDVDHFKRFNDEHGHDQGDRVLQSLADIVRETVREVDVPCRYGGEEFLVILTNTGHEGAFIVAERLREAVEETQVDGLSVTISVGVASIPHLEIENPDGLVEAADKALYTAKAAGRNRVRVA